LLLTDRSIARSIVFLDCNLTKGGQLIRHDHRSHFHQSQHPNQGFYKRSSLRRNKELQLTNITCSREFPFLAIVANGREHTSPPPRSLPSSPKHQQTSNEDDEAAIISFHQLHPLVSILYLSFAPYIIVVSILFDRWTVQL